MNELNQLVEEIIEDKKATVVVKKCESSSAVWLARDMLKNCQVAWEQ